MPTHIKKVKIFVEFLLNHYRYAFLRFLKKIFRYFVNYFTFYFYFIVSNMKLNLNLIVLLMKQSRSSFHIQNAVNSFYLRISHALYPKIPRHKFITNILIV